MNEFAEVMSKRTDAELIKILNSTPGDYQPTALEAAQSEFANRGLTSGQIAVAQQEINDQEKLKNSRSNEPLGNAWKVLSFLSRD